jgi:N-acetylmuramic acid 6-phosphate etherase
MNTEELSPRYADIDLWQPADILDAMIEGQLASVAAVRAARPQIEQAAIAIEARLRKHGRLIYVGAGTSGRLAVQDGAELMPTFSWPQERLLLLLAGGEPAMTQAIEGAEDDTARAAEIMTEHDVGPADALIAVAASGTTPFTLTCLCEAAKRGALTVGIANNPGTPLLTSAEFPIFLATGPEPIAGSTRMNAGTAQRITLNLLSTLIMIRLGRIYRGMMVEVQACNAKLAKRRERMVAHLTGQSTEPVREALERAEGSVKLAVLLLQGYELSEAEAVLERVGGRLRAALDHLAKERAPRFET